MLLITIKAGEYYDEQLCEFVKVKDTKLQLEHSLISLSKWESKWHRPFLKKDDKKTNEEVLDYIKCMTITQNVDDSTYNYLTKENCTFQKNDGGFLSLEFNISYFFALSKFKFISVISFWKTSSTSASVGS